MDNYLTRNLFEQVFELFQQAEINTKAINHYYNIAAHKVKLRFAGSAMKQVLSPAIKHLETSPIKSCSLAIYAWDSDSSKIDLPTNILDHITNSNINKNNQFLDSEHVRIFFNNSKIYGVYQVEPNILSLLDINTNKGIIWSKNTTNIPDYVRSRPFRSIIQWWAKHNNLIMFHAGAVGNSREGVLLVGKSGSGKSSTALACLNSTLKYAGDDHVLIVLLVKLFQGWHIT